MEQTCGSHLKANRVYDPATRAPNEDIRDITLGHKRRRVVMRRQRNQHIPEHDILLAGFVSHSLPAARQKFFARAGVFAWPIPEHALFTFDPLSTRVSTGGKVKTSAELSVHHHADA